jgi:hypothetical protein
MGWKVVLSSVVLLGAAGLAVFAWGQGAFYPCGPIDTLLRGSSCRVIASFPATQLQMLATLPDGTLLTAARADGPEPTAPQRLIELDTDGRNLGEAALPAVPPAISWLNAAVSPDGKLLAVSSLDLPTTVIDRSSGASLGGVQLFGPSFVGFDGSGYLLLDRGIGSFERPVSGVAQVYDLAGTQTGEISGAAAAPIFVNGIASAMSADGTRIAQHVETRGDSGIVAVRIADAAFASWSGQLLVAPLQAWRLGGQQLPELSFSPDGRYLAASFDAPREWGKENSALIVWRIDDRAMIARVPSWNAEWRHIVWLADRPAIAATRFNLDTRAGEVALISYRP